MSKTSVFLFIKSISATQAGSDAAIRYHDGAYSILFYVALETGSLMIPQDMRAMPTNLTLECMDFGRPPRAVFMLLF
jgi:hypothetical protein